MSTGAKYGFSRENKRKGLSNLFNILNAKTFDARVVDIVLNESHPRFFEAGEWNGIGTIILNKVNDVVRNELNYPLARPLFPNIKIYPLKNELVYCIKLADNDINEDGTSEQVYYFPPLSIWNHPHHNALPNVLNREDIPENLKRDYPLVGAGDERRVTDGFTDINLGETFKERLDIHPLLPFEGDVIMEGRWGNSIRFGSTVKDRPNNWSSTGSNGDPITILRNGQGDNRAEGWLPTIENINTDDSSIYLTSTQKVPINASSTNYNSYTSNSPSSPSEYANKQILINSGRLVFNTTQDHLLLTSKKSINLNAISSVNVDTKEYIAKSDIIKLGSKDATEPILKGNALVTELQNLISQIQLLVTALQAVPQTSAAAGLVSSELPKISANLELTKSKVNKII